MAEITPCVDCGVEFDPKPNRMGPPRSFCSPCRANRDEQAQKRWNAKSRRHQVTVMPCPDCGVDFDARPSGFGYLKKRCDDCKSQWQLPDPLPCPDCGELFDPSRGGKTGPHSMMCQPCQSAASKDRKAGMEAMRRAIEAGAQRAVFVSPREVYIRDSWTCHICSLEIPTELRDSQRIEVVGDSHLSPSLDHVIPCKLGGDHTLHNLKAAHHSCNARKGAGAIASDTGAVADSAISVITPEDRCAVDGCPRLRHIKQLNGTYTGKNRNKMCRTHNYRVQKVSGDPLKARCHCGCGQLLVVAPDQFGPIFIVGHSANPNRTPSAAEQLAVRFAMQPITSRGRKVGLIDDCKVWTGTLHRGGYGVVQLGARQEKRTRLVHRVAYTLAHGEDSVAGMVIDHLCGTRSCFNVNHLEAVTHAENIRRAQRGC